MALQPRKQSREHVDASLAGLVRVAEKSRLRRCEKNAPEATGSETSGGARILEHFVPKIRGPARAAVVYALPGSPSSRGSTKASGVTNYGVRRGISLTPAGSLASSLVALCIASRYQAPSIAPHILDYLRLDLQRL